MTLGKTNFLPPTVCIIEALKLCLECNNSIFNNKHLLAKDTDSFTCALLSSTCFPKNNIENIPKGVALRLRRICDSDEKFEKHSAEYQNFLIVVRDYKPGKVKNNFQTLKN